MGKQLELMASVYADEDGAKTILDTLQRMHRAYNITLADAAMVTKDANGRLHIKETREVTRLPRGRSRADRGRGLSR